MKLYLNAHSLHLLLYMSFIALLTLIEWQIAKFKKIKVHDSEQTLVNFWILFINANASFLIISFVLKNIMDIVYDFGSHWLVGLSKISYVLILFILQDFMYYWQHRYIHECRWGWATHVTHHSASHYNISVEVRENVISTISFAWILLLPLCWLGFKPSHVIAMQAFLLFYQTWVHTEVIGKLGWFDKIFNSPSNHRVHHASNQQYLDKNYGGVLIIWDHLFGSYTPEIEKPVYGVVTPINSNNPFVLYFHEFAAIFKDVFVQRSLKPIFLMPKPDASGDKSHE